MRTVYLETTIVSYYVARTSRDLIIAARQELTRKWWADKRSGYRLLASPAVREEARMGDREAARRRLDLLTGPDIEFLKPSSEVDDLAETVREALAIPKTKKFDALHLAYAIKYGVDCLLTWNCSHFANPEILRLLVNFCRANDLWLPVVCTPEAMVGYGKELDL